MIVDDGASAAFGLAADEWLMGHHAGSDGYDATLRLYTYESHCALIGRFQDLATEVRLDECAREGVDVNRRPTGGGAILMGRDQLGVALTFAADRPDLPGPPAHLYTHLAAGVVEGLETMASSRDSVQKTTSKRVGARSPASAYAATRAAGCSSTRACSWIWMCR